MHHLPLNFSMYYTGAVYIEGVGTCCLDEPCLSTRCHCSLRCGSGLHRPIATFSSHLQCRMGELPDISLPFMIESCVSLSTRYVSNFL